MLRQGRRPHGLLLLLLLTCCCSVIPCLLFCCCTRPVWGRGAGGAGKGYSMHRVAAACAQRYCSAAQRVVTSRHISCTAVQVDNTTFATVLELCEGGDLETHLQAHHVRASHHLAEQQSSKHTPATCMRTCMQAAHHLSPSLPTSLSLRLGCLVCGADEQ